MNIIYEKEIRTKIIMVSPKPVWKCRACTAYNMNPACPPYVPSYRETKDWIKSFDEALLIKCSIDYMHFEDEKRKMLLYLLNKEKILFKKNPYSFALFPGSCNLCEICVFKEKKICAKPTAMRPSIDALGIEITSIANIDFKESVLYGIVMIK